MPAPKDLIHETSTTTGTGNLTVAAVNGKVRFSDSTYAFGTGGSDVFDYFISNRAAAEWERGTGHMSDANTLVRDTVIASSNSDAAVNFSAGTKDVTNDVPAHDQYYVKANGFDMPLNLGLSASAGSSALTIALKGADGNDPSESNPVRIPFRNVTSATGTPSWLSVTAASSLVVSSGSTLGVTSSTAFRLWVVSFNDGGTFRLGVINCVVGGLGTVTVHPMTEWGVASSTAEGGAGAADSAGVFYTGTAVTSKAYRILGFIEWSASGLTAGTWTTTNLNRIQLFGPAVHLPGAVIQRKLPTPGGSDFSTSSNSYLFATGNSQSITPTSAANIIHVKCSCAIETNAASRLPNFQLSRGTTSNTNLFGYVSAAKNNGSSILVDANIWGYDKPNTASSQAYGVQAKSVTSDSITFYGSSGPAAWELSEVMG